MSGTAKDLWRKADQARDAARWRTAVELYGQAIAAGGESAALYVQYGHALKETGTPAAAEAAYRRAIALQPELADSYLQLGHALKVQGKLHEAALSYLQAHVAGDASNHSMTELMALGWRKEIIEQVAHSRSSNAPSLSVELALAKLTMDVSALSEKVDSKLEQLEAILRDLNWIMSEQRAHATGAGEGGPGAGGGVGAIETELYAIRSHLWLLNSKLLTISERQLPA